MRTTTPIFSLLAVLLVTACDGGSSEPAKPSAPAPAPAPAAAPPAERAAPTAEVELDARVQKAASLAKKIEATPEQAETILAEASMEREQLDALMREIAADPALIEQYRIARGT